VMKTCRQSRSVCLDFSVECVGILNNLWGPCLGCLNIFNLPLLVLIYNCFVHVSSFQAVHRV
jgi:hypothetical protein